MILSEKNNIGSAFHEAIWPVLAVAQLFGVFPVIGIRDLSMSTLQFKWISIRTFHSLVIGGILSGYVLLLFRKIVSTHAGFEIIGILKRFFVMMNKFWHAMQLF